MVENITNFHHGGAPGLWADCIIVPGRGAISDAVIVLIGLLEHRFCRKPVPAFRREALILRRLRR
jgi:hypothetical protein